MRIIGITGPTGAGKSLLCSELEKNNIPTVDADSVYHSLLVPPSECLDALRREFGDGVFAPDGTLDRKALGKIVFSDRGKLALLNSTVLSIVIAKIREIIADHAAKGGEVIAIDAPTLIESGFSAECDTVISVLAPKELRIARIVERDRITHEEAQRRVNAQKSDDFYIAHSDLLLINDKDAELFLDEVRDILGKNSLLLDDGGSL